jgi:deoxyribodipyrimidine photolyase-related protein
MMTKPYISSSNYIQEMSHYDDGDWTARWDGLYWSFIDRNRDVLDDIQRIAVIVATLDRMDEDTLDTHRANASELREQLRSTGE